MLGDEKTAACRTLGDKKAAAQVNERTSNNEEVGGMIIPGAAPPSDAAFRIWGAKLKGRVP